MGGVQFTDKSYLINQVNVISSASFNLILHQEVGKNERYCFVNLGQLLAIALQSGTELVENFSKFKRKT